MIVSWPGQCPKAIRPDKLNTSFSLFSLNRLPLENIFENIVNVSWLFTNFAVTNLATKQNVSTVGFYYRKKGKFNFKPVVPPQNFKMLFGMWTKMCNVVLASSNIKVVDIIEPWKKIRETYH